MKTIIKKFLLKYTDPKLSGISADELAGMLEKELNEKPKLNIKWREQDDKMFNFDRTDSEYENEVGK